jgi:hypothetical protein
MFSLLVMDDPDRTQAWKSNGAAKRQVRQTRLIETRLFDG